MRSVATITNASSVNLSDRSPTETVTFASNVKSAIVNSARLTMTVKLALQISSLRTTNAFPGIWQLAPATAPPATQIFNA